MYQYQDLIWKGDQVYLRGKGKPLLRIVPDEKYPSMWRIKCPDGQLSGMLNRTRAQDAGRAIALQTLNKPRLEAAE